MEWHEAIAVIIAIIAGLLLLAMDPVLGVIDIEHDHLGWLGIGGDKLLEEHQSHAGECGP